MKALVVVLFLAAFVVAEFAFFFYSVDSLPRAPACAVRSDVSDPVFSLACTNMQLRWRASLLTHGSAFWTTQWVIAIGFLSLAVATALWYSAKRAGLMKTR